MMVMLMAISVTIQTIMQKQQQEEYVINIDDLNHDSNKNNGKKNTNNISNRISTARLT